MDPLPPKGIKSFTQIIDMLAPNSTEEISVLPFCHTTSPGAASDILLNGITPPQQCDKYHEFLVYFFYGKACYLVESELANYFDNPPITFIYDQEVIKKHFTQMVIKRILPFDSGGFERYDLRRGFNKEMFTYKETTLHKIIGYIRLLFKNHTKYLNDDINLEDLTFYKDNCLPINEIIEVYKKAYSGKIPSGQQVYSIELQFANNIQLNPSHLVIPYDLYTDTFWGTNVKQSFPDVKIVDYGREEILKKPGKVLTAGEYQDLMRKKVLEIVNNYVENNPSLQ